jgi:tetratricopeptide (TPR) repeat protein
MSTSYDHDLQSYFTDMEQQQIIFKGFVAAEKLPKRLIVLHGVGGVGKSSLLRMFRLYCKSEKIPVALASGDDAKSVLDVVIRWTEDLKGNGVKFAALSKTLESYRTIQAKVEEQVKKSRNKAVDIASKAASKTAETAGGALLGAAIGSVIPGIGTAIGGALGGVVSGMGAEALTDWLRGFLSKPDIDLLLDPAKKLSADFIEEIAKAAEKKRMVLLLDTFEQMSALEDWVGETAQMIHPNVLVVIAGRKLPDWQRVWHGWMMNAQVEELKPMTEDVMGELICRYYATMRGGEPDPAQVDAIIKFARGLPMAVTSAVQLWVKYGVEDFQSIKAEIVANLVDRLMEGVPSALIPALEAAAVVRWFDQPILRAVTKQEDVRNVYNELRRFPFVRTRIEGLALHDSVRDMLDENLRVQDSERHAELHERAAVFFEKKLEKVTGEEVERLGLERLYHRIRADEETGIKLFQEMGEELTQYRLVNRLRALLNDVNMYTLESENSRLWLDYYQARSAYLEGNLEIAINAYKKIDENEQGEAKLKAYALCDLAKSLADEVIFQKGNMQEVINLVEKSNRLFSKSDPKQVLTLLALGKASHRLGDIDTALDYFTQALNIFQDRGDIYGESTVLGSILDSHAVRGDLRRMLDAQTQGLSLLSDKNRHSAAYVHFLSSWACMRTWAGRYRSTEDDVNIGLSILKNFGDVLLLHRNEMELGLAQGMQGKIKEAEYTFNQSSYNNLTERKEGGFLTFRGIALLKCGNLEKADEYLKTGWELTRESKKLRYFPENLYWIGMLWETKANLEQSENWYYQCLDFRDTGRRYFECAALAGLIRVKHAQGDIVAIPSLLAEAERLAQQYEYNDHLASLRLTRGHLKADASEVSETSEALGYYKQAMIYALRYNRFLLDELVSGRPQGTPLRPIIPYCLECGEFGRRILLALQDWWQTGFNDIDVTRPDTISPIPEGIPLLEAEMLARQREPGDGFVQKSILEQLEAAT